MSEVDPPKHVHDTNSSKIEAVRARELVDIVEWSLKLIEALKSSNAPDRTEYMFDFPIEFSASFELPNLINEWGLTHTVTCAKVSVVHENDQPLTSVSIDFFDDEDNMLTVSRSPTELSTAPDVDVIVNPHKINSHQVTTENPYAGTIFYKMPKNELVTFITGLISGDRPPAEMLDYDLFYADKFDLLTEALRSRAYSTFTSTEFHSEKQNVDYIACTELDGDLQTLTICCNNAATKDKIAIHIDCQEGMNVNFQQQNGDITSSFNPSVDELAYFRSIITSEYTANELPAPLSLEEIIASLPDDDQTF